MSLEYNKKLIPRAKELRKNMTKEEKHLWYDYLKSYPVRFQRQKTIDNYITDFYCHKAKLVLEIDGIQHSEEENRLYDIERDKILNSYDLTVLRIKNSDIKYSFNSVCEKIDNTVKELLR